MTLNVFIYLFYSLGIVPIAECIMGSLKYLKKNCDASVLHDIFGLSLLISTVSWCFIGISIGEYIVNFAVIIILEILPFLLNLFTDYQEKKEVYLFRKLIVTITVSWIILDAFQKIN